MRALVIAVVAAAALAGCTKAHVKIINTTSTSTSTVTHTQSAPTPLAAGPTTSSGAPACPLLDKQTAADAIGMRLARITVQRSRGRVVGCRIYALQGSPLSRSEHLPPADQPAVQITTARYASPMAARTALIFAARRGAAPQRTTLHGVTGACYQVDFYKADKGKDWTCAYTVGARLVIVRTVVVSPSFNAVAVTRAVRVT